MRLVLVLVFILSVTLAQAQQRFEGSIVYKLHTPYEKSDAEVLLQFGPNRIKVQFKEKENYDKNYLLIDLDSGKVYTLNADSKTYQSKKLSERLPAPSTTVKTIAGHQTTSVAVTNSGLSGIFGAAGTTVLYTAQDLFYPVPEKYEGIPELIMVRNNHIVLGAEIKTSYPGMNEDLQDSVAENLTATAEASKISAQSFDKAAFSVPADFTFQKGRQYLMTDTAYAATDSVALADTTVASTTPSAKQAGKPKPKPATPKKNTTIKSEAIKPKKTQSKT